MDIDPVEVKYFKRHQAFIPTFWSRFPSDCRDIKGKRILEVGSGHGDLAIDMALKGASEVVGIDIKCAKIDFAEKNIHKNHINLEDVITFKCCEISDLPENPFDIIVSKNTFEHLMNPAFCLDEMKKRLRPKGKVLIGFSPLYNSPFGDHGRTKTQVPWGHLIFKEKWIINRLNKGDMKRQIKRIEDLELNKYSLKKWKELFYSSGFDVHSFEVNSGRNIILRFVSLLRRILFLEEFLSFNLFVVLVKR
jgi:2-polyprenyl-3-methyl-5-hydroxy-6-metoxy-1,4-benzoquinol methylase